jgi:hypothetical protein
MSSLVAAIYAIMFGVACRYLCCWGLVVVAENPFIRASRVSRVGS